MSGDRKSFVDYIFMTSRSSTKLAKLTIDEEGVASVGSDHNGILAVFGGPRHREMIPNFPRERTLREDEIEAIARKPEKVTDKSMGYETTVNCNNLKTRKMMIGKSMSTRKVLKRWWHHEIKRAIEVRQEACRCHQGERETKVKNELWKKFKETKEKCKQVFQMSRRAVRKRKLQDLRAK